MSRVRVSLAAPINKILLSRYQAYYKNYYPLSLDSIARVVELVDTRDLKSLACKSVTVQVRPRVPFHQHSVEI